MLKNLSVAIFSLFITFNVNADDSCFIAKENGKIVKELGKCDKAHPPFSTFKIPIALMGFDSGILKSPDLPVINFSKQIEQRVISYYNSDKYPIQMFWLRDHNPATWMKYSVVWFSQELTKALGRDKFKSYVSKLNYGNRDVSGDPGKDNGLTHAWLGSSLKISPRDQVNFIEKLSNKELPFLKVAQENTIKLISLENVYDWKLYGKSGGGMALGWFVGWIEKDSRKIVFAQYVEPERPIISGGKLAKELALDNLVSVILSK